MMQSIEKFYNQSFATEISQYITFSRLPFIIFAGKKEELGLEFELFL